MQFQYVLDYLKAMITRKECAVLQLHQDSSPKRERQRARDELKMKSELMQNSSHSAELLI